jgi:hypothetical protein
MSYRQSWDTPEYRRAVAQREADERAREQQEAAEQRERARLNAEARDRWQAKLAADKAAKQAEWDAQLDAELAPTKGQEQRRWLADHPDKSAADFERTWREHLRPYHLEQRREQQIERTMAEMRTSGRYIL